MNTPFFKASPPNSTPVGRIDSSDVESHRLVSLAVITATLNCAALIEPLIDSLRRQTDADFCWLVADGCSTDGTLDRINASGLADVRVTSEADFSIYDALNRAIQCCSSDYYLVIGADDTLEPDAIAEFRRAAIRTGAALVVASVKTFGTLRTPLKGWRWLRGGNAITASHAVGTLFRRDLHQRLGYYSNRYVSAADMHFVLKVASDPSMRIEGISAVAGTFSNEGLSSSDELLSLSDFFRLQIANGESAVLQTGLFGLRLLRVLLKRRSSSL